MSLTAPVMTVISFSKNHKRRASTIRAPGNVFITQLAKLSLAQWAMKMETMIRANILHIRSSYVTPTVADPQWPRVNSNACLNY